MADDPSACDKGDMANYGTVSRYRLRSLSDWMSSRDSKFAKVFQFDRMARVGSSGTSVTMEFGPMRIEEMLHPPSRSYLLRHVELRVVRAIDQAFIDVVLSACDGTIEVGDLSDIVSIECHRFPECRGSTICSGPGFRLDRPVFMSNWDLVIIGHLPHGEVVRIDHGRCSLIPGGWPRIDGLASHLMDGGTMLITICIEEASAVARYRFVEDRGEQDANQSR